MDDDHRRGDLPDELQQRRYVVDIVDRADCGDQGTAEQNRVRRSTGILRHPDKGGQQHPGEDRQPAEPRRLLHSKPPLPRFVHRADASSEPRRQRRQQRRGSHRNEEGENGVPVPHARQRIAARSDPANLAQLQAERLDNGWDGAEHIARWRS